MRFNVKSRSVTALVVSIAVFAGVLFCTVDTLSAAVLAGHSAHQHAHLHTQKSEYLVSPRGAHSDETDLCCEQLLAVRPSTGLAIALVVQSIPASSSVSILVAREFEKTSIHQFSPQKIPRVDIAGKIVQNKRNKLHLKIQPPFGPPA